MYKLICLNKSKNKSLSNTLHLYLAIFFTITLLVTITSQKVIAESQYNKQKIYSFNIPSSSLKNALDLFATETGIFFSGSGDLIENKKTAGVRGDMTTEQALNKLLLDTDITYVFTNSDTITLRKLVADSDLSPMQPIIVKGQLQERTLQDTQTSVSVYTGEELESRSEQSLRLIAERTAGVTTSARGIGFVIRGVDERGVSANGSSAPAITTSIDGARITDFGRINTTFLSTWDLEQVEVLRGPQSTQSGRNALAGAVIVRSKDPTYEKEVKVRAGAGNFDALQGAAAINLPIYEDKLAVRLSGDFNETDGFVDNIATSRDDDGRVENYTLRGALRFDPIERFSGVLKVSYIDGFDGFASSASEFSPDAIVNTDAETSDEFDYTTVNLRLGYDISDEIRIESESVYVDREFLFSGDFDGGPNPDATATDLSKDDSFSQEIKLLYNSERTNAVIGGFYTEVDTANQTIGESDSAATLRLLGAEAFIPFLTPGSSAVTDSDNSSETENYAIFGEVDYKLFDGLRFIAGGRYDNEKQTRVNRSTTSTDDPFLGASFAPLFNSTNTRTSTKFDAFIPKIGLVYEFNDDVSLGFTYQEGYRAGGATFNLARAQELEFDPEFTDNYELSFRSTLFDNKLVVNTNAYYTEFTDQQVVVELSANPLDVQTENAGESESLGGELEIRALPTDNLDLFAVVGYNETEFKDFVSNGQQLAGNEFRNAPNWTGSFGGVYYMDNGFYIGSDLSYTSESYSDAENTRALRSDERIRLNLRTGIETDYFSFFAYVDNLTDEDYIEEALLGSVTIGPPRTYGVLLNVKLP